VLLKYLLTEFIADFIPPTADAFPFLISYELIALVPAYCLLT